MPRGNPGKRRAKGAGRPARYAKQVTVNLTAEAIQIVDMIGGTRSEAINELIRQSVQYRLEFGSEEKTED